MKILQTRYLIPVAAAAALATTAQAQVIYNTVGATYSENFNWSTGGNNTASAAWISNNATQSVASGVTWTGNSTGWYAGNATQDSSQIRVGNGNDSNNAGLTINNFFFNSGDTDRSFGGRPANTVPLVMALRLTNNTGITLTQFTLGYRLETTQWRANGVHATANVGYFIGNPTDWRTGSFTSTPSLNLTTIYGGNATLNNQNVDGNASGNFTSTSGTVTGLSWVNGQDLWIRWTFASGSTVFPNVGLDDVSFVAVPEPTAWALLAAGLSAVVIFRRRRKA
jgi:hypothetical protein